MSLSADKLDLAAAAVALNNCPIGHTIDYHQSVPSTMPLAHQRAADPATRSGTIIIAEEQTAGRGRSQRRWNAPAGQALLLSIILKAPIPMPIRQVSMRAGLAAIDAITTHLPTLERRVGLKWPNDLLVGNGMADARKVGGILAESSFYDNAPVHVIIGMGINVLQKPTHLPPTPTGAPASTSLAHFLAKADSSMAAPAPDSALLGLLGSTGPTLPNRTALLIALCQAWAGLVDPLLAPDDVWAQWRAQLWTLGHVVTIQTNAADDTDQERSTAAICQGKAVDVTADGQLVIADNKGRRHTFAAGDVSVRRV